MTGLAWPGPVLRRPPAIVGVDTQPMPRVTDAVQLLPAVRRPGPPAVQVPALDLSWTALDLLLLPVAAWLAAGWPAGRHRHGQRPGRHRPAPSRRRATGPPAAWTPRHRRPRHTTGAPA